MTDKNGQNYTYYIWTPTGDKENNNFSKGVKINKEQYNDLMGKICSLEKNNKNEWCLQYEKTENKQHYLGEQTEIVYTVNNKQWLVIGGTIVGLCAAGLVFLYTKKPPFATTAATGTAKIIGGAEGAKKVKQLLNIISFSDNTYKKFILFLTAAALQNKASSQENSYNVAKDTYTLPVDPILLDLRDNNIKIKQNKKHQKTNNKTNSVNQGIEKRYNDVLRGNVEHIEYRDGINPLWNKTIDEIMPRVKSKKYNLNFLYNLKSNKILNTVSSIEKNNRARVLPIRQQKTR